MIQIAIMGHGVVGSGVVEVLTVNAESIKARAKEEIHIKYVLDLREFPDSPIASRFTKDFEAIVNDPDIRVVAEVMGGITPAYDYVKRLLLAGKSVVTSNKELVAAKGAELLNIAMDKNVNFLFEASVGGGIPIIRPISQCLAANEVSEIAGILNGTTNFILTKMIREQMSFDDALNLAQELGYAERNPSADVDGHDSCRKICILASLAFGKHVYPEQVYTEGIRNITLQDVEYAESWGGVIKLISIAKPLPNGKLQVITAPMFVSRSSQLSSVDDVFNGIMVRGDATGDVVFYGKGAGKLPTASAVVADIIDCVKHLNARKYLFWAEGEPNYVEDSQQAKFAAYVRLASADMPRVLEHVGAMFGNVQMLNRQNQPKTEVAFVTRAESWSALKAECVKLGEQGATILNVIRVGDL